MTELSQNELAAIKAHPVRRELDAFRETFKSRYLKCENASVTEVIDQLTSGASDGGEKDAILDLILALLAQPAARTIRSRTGNGPLSGDIASFYARLSSEQEPAKHVAPLLKLVLTQQSDVTPQASDVDIWAAVLDLISLTRPIPQPTTPPQSRPSFTSSFQQTPWSFNTGSFADASEHRKEVDNVLKEELLPSLRIDIPNFIHAVFGHVPSLDEVAGTVFHLCQDMETVRMALPIDAYQILSGTPERQGTYVDFDIGINLCREYNLAALEERLLSLKRASEWPVEPGLSQTFNSLPESPRHASILPQIVGTELGRSQTSARGSPVGRSIQAEHTYEPDPISDAAASEASVISREPFSTPNAQSQARDTPSIRCEKDMSSRQSGNDTKSFPLEGIDPQSPSAIDSHYSVWNSEPQYSLLNEVKLDLKPQSWKTASPYESFIATS
ncbi:MAG: hypothetical protein M1812_005791 [Candelaria pacifica]|nr:MAG: hypothetical protein M1812_005791 [Candelaria pacifica]